MSFQSPVMRCPVCDKKAAKEAYPWRCECGESFVLDGAASIDFNAIKGLPLDFWRYHDVFPIREVPEELRIVDSWTDLTPFVLDNRTVYLKHEYRLPGGSFKDRGAAVLAAHVHEAGVDEVVEDTSGNAGVALSYYAGKLGITCHIYSTTTLNPVKEKKIRESGALLHKVSPDRQAVTDEALRQVREKYYASHTFNPYFLHGVKSMAYELFEQLGNRVPDAVVVPVGNGTLILGLALGFRELRTMGYSPKFPKLVGVQAAARCPVVSAFTHSVSESSGETNIADGIDVANPPRIRQILSAVAESGGTMLTVSNKDIEAEMKLREVFTVNIEPTSLAATAGVRKYIRQSEHIELLVIPLTGANC